MNSAAVLRTLLCTQAYLYVLGHHLGDALRSPGFSQAATYLRRPRCDAWKLPMQEKLRRQLNSPWIFLPGWDDQPLRDKPNPIPPYP